MVFINASQKSGNRAIMHLIKVYIFQVCVLQATYSSSSG